MTAAHRAAGALIAGALGLAACDPADHYVVITVDARPSVHGARAVAVALSNAGTTRLDALALRDQPFPVTFSVSAPGRTGELGVSVEATDDAGLVVGRGNLTTTVEAATADLVLEPADFVVNTDYADDQLAADDLEAAGFQLAALPDGTWTAVFRDQAPGMVASHIFGRRFDGTGSPVTTQLAASTRAVELTTQTTTRGSTPAVAASPTTTLVVWDLFTPDDVTRGLGCRVLDHDGRAMAAQAMVTTEPADVVSVTALASGDFLAAWTTFATDVHVIRSLVIRPDCSALAPPETVSAATDDARRGSLASSTDRALFAWIVAGDLHIRIASATGVLGDAERILVHRTASEAVVHARVAASASSPGGFVVAVRWAQSGGTGPGRIELYRIDPQGSPLGGPSVVTARTASDFDTAQSFGIASRSDGTVLVTWHNCGELGDGDQCGVFGRFMRDTGEPLGDELLIPTTTKADQRLPSAVSLGEAFVVMWSDTSAAPPDDSGTAVRARLLYPPGSLAPDRGHPASDQRQADDQPRAGLGAP